MIDGPSSERDPGKANGGCDEEYSKSGVAVDVSSSNQQNGGKNEP